MSEGPSSPDASRRDFLVYATLATAAIGTGLALWPFIDSMNPSADVLAGASTDVDLAPLRIGQRLTVRWRGKPVFIARRTDHEIRDAAEVDITALRDPERDADRVLQPQYLIVVGVCTHLGCIPLGERPADPRGAYGGWFCPCHGSVYDTSGRIRQGPAPKNLLVPHYAFTGPQAVTIGSAGGPKAASA